MLVQKLKIAFLAALMLSASLAAPATAEEAAEPLNVGVVVYHKTDTPGALIARWNFANRYSGPGLATGGPGDGFAGHYHVRYFLEDGTFSDEYDLAIGKTGDFYDVAWIVGGVVKARGVGMEVDHGSGLAVGWRRVDR